jgi:hypothetical protein
MRMSGKALGRLNWVFIDHRETAKPSVPWVIGVAEENYGGYLATPGLRGSSLTGSSDPELRQSGVVLAGGRR